MTQKGLGYRTVASLPKTIRKAGTVLKYATYANADDRSALWGRKAQMTRLRAEKWTHLVAVPFTSPRWGEQVAIYGIKKGKTPSHRGGGKWW